MWENQRVSVVFPAYNEADSIADAVTNFLAVPAVDEVVVIDNNSRDGTGDLAAAAGARVVREEKQGYGHALQRGLAEADGGLIILAEPDGTFDARDVPKLLVYSGDVDLVLGTRTTRELIWEQANMGLVIRWGNWAVAKFLQVLFNTPSLTDCGCTMRLIRRDGLERIRPLLTVGGSHFLPEMVILARLSGLSMLEVPLNYRRRAGVSKITGDYGTAVRVGLNMIRLITRYRARSLASAARTPASRSSPRPAPRDHVMSGDQT
jgi:glycosyltransferase involved in cell wall biosynthesis